MHAHMWLFLPYVFAVEKFEDDSKDNSVFDKILSINQQAGR